MCGRLHDLIGDANVSTSSVICSTGSSIPEPVETPWRTTSPVYFAFACSESRSDLVWQARMQQLWRRGGAAPIVGGVGGSVILAVAVMYLRAMFATHDIYARPRSLRKPSMAHWLGTDELGLTQPAGIRARITLISPPDGDHCRANRPRGRNHGGLCRRLVVNTVRIVDVFLAFPSLIWRSPSSRRWAGISNAVSPFRSPPGADADWRAETLTPKSDYIAAVGFRSIGFRIIFVRDADAFPRWCARHPQHGGILTAAGLGFLRLRHPIGPAGGAMLSSARDSC